jgi:hypothetical protein
MAPRGADAGGDETEADPDHGGDALDDAEAIAAVRCARPGPASIEDWVSEIIAVYARLDEPDPRRPPPRPDDAHAHVVAAVRGCIASRAAAASPAAEEELVGVVEELVGELDAMGPEWSSLREVRPLAFTVYYLWTHIVIDQISDDLAMEVVRAATARLPEFERQGGGTRPGRQRRPGAS